MRAALLAMVVASQAAALPAATARPLRVMSLNVCTDQIVLALLPPERITSVTALARDPRTSVMARAAARVRVNHGLTEEVLGERPDLVIAGTFTTTATRQMLKRLGWPVLEIGSLDTIAQIHDGTRRIGRAVGEGARAEALLTRMDAQLTGLRPIPGPPLRVAAWDGGGFAASKGSLYDTVLTLAGVVNVAAGPGSLLNSSPDTELLLATAPALLVRGGAYDQGSLRANLARHAVIREVWGPRRSLAIRPAYYQCGTPFVVDEVLALRARLQAAASAAGAPLPFAARLRR